MQQVRSNRESAHETVNREGKGGESSATARPELSSLLNDYTNSQRYCMYFNFFFLLPSLMIMYKIFR